jgi:hypothetical protein
MITSKEYGWVISNIEKTIIKDSQIKNWKPNTINVK